ncbi:MAG: 6-bladed beta-propeller [Bacillota bacterium]
MADRTRYRQIAVGVTVAVLIIAAGGWFLCTRKEKSCPVLMQHNLPEKVVQVLAGKPEAPLQTPLDVAVAPDGRIFVADAGNNAVQVFYPWGRPRGFLGRGKIKFTYPNTVAVDANGRVYVGEFAAGRIRVFSARGEFKQKIDASTAGVPLQPLDLAVGADGRLYVADRRGAVYVLDKKGRLLRRIDQVAAEPETLAYPNGIAVDDAGDIAVSDSGNRRVLLFGADGKLLRVIESGEMSHPRGTGFWGKELIVVADTFGNRLLAFSRAGRLVKNIKAENSPGLSFAVSNTLLNGLAVFEDRVYVTDRIHNIVLIFGRD